MPAPPSQLGYPSGPPSLILDRKLSFLTAREVMMIDDLLASLGAWGEVHLTVQKGKLRFISSTRSFDALKWGLCEDS